MTTPTLFCNFITFINKNSNRQKAAAWNKFPKKLSFVKVLNKKKLIRLRTLFSFYMIKNQFLLIYTANFSDKNFSQLQAPSFARKASTGRLGKFKDNFSRHPYLVLFHFNIKDDNIIASTFPVISSISRGYQIQQR